MLPAQGKKKKIFVPVYQTVTHNYYKQEINYKK